MAPYPPVAVLVLVLVMDVNDLESLVGFDVVFFFMAAGDGGTGCIILCATTDAVTTSKVRAVNWWGFGGSTIPV